MSGVPNLLRSDVFVCYPTDYHAVLLDLSNDDYLCIGRRRFDRIVQMKCRRERMLEHSSKDDSEALELMEELAKFGLLTANAECGKPFAPADIAGPVTSLSRHHPRSNWASKLRYVVPFLIAAGKASYCLRRWHLKRTVEMVARRRSTRRSRTKQSNSELAKLLGVFDALRPLYPRDYLCIFDSLALIEFLARYGVYPQWIFAATADPFEAHCWVQEGKVVINDSIWKVSHYRPVMST